MTDRPADAVTCPICDGDGYHHLSNSYSAYDEDGSPTGWLLSEECATCGGCGWVVPSEPVQRHRED